MTPGIHLGDCYELLPAIPTGSVDLLLTDPPYGTTNAAWDGKIDIPAFFEQVWRACKPNAAVLIFSQLPFACDLINAARNRYRYDIVWAKNDPTGFLNAKKMPLRAHELILVFYRALPTFNPQKTHSTPYHSKGSRRKSEIYGPRGDSLNPETQSLDGSRYPTDVLRYRRERHAPHPTQKPLALVENLILQYSNPGDLILDPFAGSGTTALAARNTARRCIAIERDPSIHATALRRLATTHTPNII